MYEGDETNFDAAPPEENNNRTFILIAGGLGVIVLLAIICLAVYALVLLPQQQANRTLAANAQATQGAQIAGALTATFQASIVPTTTLTPLPSPTPLVAQAPATETPLPPTPDPSTATVAVALTQVAAPPLTPASAAGIPRTGIMDEYGFPGLLIATVLLIAVILLARRMRTAPVKNR